MDYFCHFHPTSAARWCCSKCHRYFDHACALAGHDHKAATPACPVCQGTLRPLQNQAQAVAEASLLKGFLFTSPFILLICSLVLLAAISSFAQIQATLLMFLNQLAVFFINFHYGRQIVFSKVITFEARTSSKRLSPSRTNQDSSWSVLQASLKSAIPFVILYLLPVLVFYHANWLAGLLLMLITVFMAPYLLLFMLHQLDPKRQIEAKKLMPYVRASYGRLSLLNLVLYFGCLIIIDFAYHHGELSLSLMLGSSLVSLSLLILFYSHARLYRNFIRDMDSISAESKTTTAKKHQGMQTAPANKRADKHPQLSSEIELALKTGNYSHAVDLLEHALQQNRHSVLRKQQLYLLLSELNDLQKLSQHAEHFLGWMLERGKIREASQFLYRIRKHDPSFMLHNPSMMSELAKQFTRQKKYALVLWLAESCQKRFAPSEELASIYLCASQVLVTHYQDLRKAEDYLLYIIKHCTACESTEAAKALLTHLQNNQSHEQQLRE